MANFFFPNLLKLEENSESIVKYPYLYSDFTQEYPNTLLPELVTEETLEGYPLVFVKNPDTFPIYNIDTQYVVEVTPVKIEGIWYRNYEVRELSEEEILRLYNAKANWALFYNSLLTNSAFNKARAGAAVELPINAAYTDTANALALAAQGLVNTLAIQACIFNLFSVLTGDYALTQEEIDSLQALLEQCYLDRLISLTPTP